MVAGDDDIRADFAAGPKVERYEEGRVDSVPRWPPTLWSLHGIPARAVLVRTWHSVLADRIFGHAAELGFYFLFALFPTLFSASSILGLAAQSAPRIYDHLLDYLSLLIPTAALGTVLHTFNETTAASSSGKLTFGLIAAIWSASVGVSAVQDTLNDVYGIDESRSYLKARLYAIGLTILLTVIVTLGLSALFGGDLGARLATRLIRDPFISSVLGAACRLLAWIVATIFLTLSFAIVYNWAPDIRRRDWRWITPGAVIGIAGWLVASLGFRLYLHFFNNFSVTYGSLGAVIILLTWFYLTGLMLLLGAEINCRIGGFASVGRTIRSRHRAVDSSAG